MRNEEKVINYLSEHKKATTLELSRKLWLASPRKIISIIRSKSTLTGLTIISEKVHRNGKCFNEYRLAKCKKRLNLRYLEHGKEF